MASNFCLPKNLADNFLAKVKDGTINPGKLTDMSTEERQAFFKDIVGEKNAKDTNTLFESKLLLKNQQAGLVRWAQKLAGLSPSAKTDIIAKIQKLDTALDPETEKAFLKDIVESKLKVNVSAEEAKQILELASKVGTRETNPNYGEARVNLENYMNERKQETSQNKLIKAANNLASIPKALKASLSDHALGRQALPVLFTHPQSYFRNAAESIANIVRVIGGKNAVDGTRAYMYNDPLFDEMLKAGLEVNMKGEEAYPTDIPSKVPVLGRFYKASKDSFEILNAVNRFDLYKQLRAVGEKTGVDMTDSTEQKSLANMVNSLTGRGRIKGVGSTAQKTANNLLFSPKLWKAHFDVLTAHQGQGETTFVKKQAALNLLKIIGGMATIMGMANVLRPGSATTDTKSSDFGKIKVGNTRFDYSGGAANLVVLASRLYNHATTSSTTGKTTPLDQKNSDGTPKFGSKTTQDVISEYLQGKLSPIAATALMARTGTDRVGNPVTLGSLTSNLLNPLPVQSLTDSKMPGAANKLAIFLTNMAGIGTDTYAPASPSVSAQVKAIKSKTESPAQKMLNAKRAEKAKATRLRNQQKILNSVNSQKP